MKELLFSSFLSFPRAGASDVLDEAPLCTVTVQADEEWSADVVLSRITGLDEERHAIVRLVLRGIQDHASVSADVASFATLLVKHDDLGVLLRVDCLARVPSQRVCMVQLTDRRVQLLLTPVYYAPLKFTKLGCLVPIASAAAIAVVAVLLHRRVRLRYYQ